MYEPDEDNIVVSKKERRRSKKAPKKAFKKRNKVVLCIYCNEEQDKRHTRKVLNDVVCADAEPWGHNVVALCDIVAQQYIDRGQSSRQRSELIYLTHAAAALSEGFYNISSDIFFRYLKSSPVPFHPAFLEKTQKTYNIRNTETCPYTAQYLQVLLQQLEPPSKDQLGSCRNK